jgi:hypothetical protein
MIVNVGALAANVEHVGLNVEYMAACGKAPVRSGTPQRRRHRFAAQNARWRWRPRDTPPKPGDFVLRLMMAGFVRQGRAGARREPVAPPMQPSGSRRARTRDRTNTS